MGTHPSLSEFQLMHDFPFLYFCVLQHHLKHYSRLPDMKGLLTLSLKDFSTGQLLSDLHCWTWRLSWTLSQKIWLSFFFSSTLIIPAGSDSYSLHELLLFISQTLIKMVLWLLTESFKKLSMGLTACKKNPSKTQINKNLIPQ